MIPMLERYRGSLLGLACGDAVGTSVEFQRPGEFEPVTDMLGGGPFNLQAGQWTDDTSMALCLAESLITCKGFDPRDQMERYRRWLVEGHLSSTGGYIDSGRTVREAIQAFQTTGEPYSGDQDPWSAGNGSLMRVAPIALYFQANPRQALTYAANSSRTTHGAPEAIDACRYFVGLLIGALKGISKATLLQPLYCPIPDYWTNEPLAPKIHEVASGSFLEREPPDIDGRGYVVSSLEAALWAFARGQTFREGCLRAVNLGRDADTTAAVYGQLAGAYYGEQAIPVAWRERLALRETITEYAEGLYKQA